MSSDACLSSLCVRRHHGTAVGFERHVFPRPQRLCLVRAKTPQTGQQDHRLLLTQMGE